MPNVKDFLKAFKLEKNKIINDLIITKINAVHYSIMRYKEYQYDIDVYLKSENKYNKKELFNILKNYLNIEKIVYTSYGNPYKCYISDIDINIKKNIYHANIIGYAYRI